MTRLLPASLVATLAVVLSGCGPSLREVGGSALGGSLCSILWLVLAITALLDLWKSSRDDTKKLVWTVIIVVVPVLGSIIYHLSEKPKS